MTNNTTGASIFDLGNIIKADSIAEVTDILKDDLYRQLIIAINFNIKYKKEYSLSSIWLKDLGS